MVAYATIFYPPRRFEISHFGGIKPRLVTLPYKNAKKSNQQKKGFRDERVANIRLTILNSAASKTGSDVRDVKRPGRQGRVGKSKRSKKQRPQAQSLTLFVFAGLCD